MLKFFHSTDPMNEDDSGEEAPVRAFETISPTTRVAYEFEAFGDGAAISIESSSNGS